MQQPLAEPVQAGKKIQPPQHNSQILVMSLLDPVSQPKCQIKKVFMKVTDHFTESTFLLDNSTTRTVASGRELELPASLVISHQSSGYERWPVTTSTTEQMSARTESRLSQKLPHEVFEMLGVRLLLQKVQTQVR